MLSEDTLRLFRLVFLLASKTRSIPLHWDARAQLLDLDLSPRARRKRPWVLFLLRVCKILEICLMLLGSLGALHLTIVHARANNVDKTFKAGQLFATFAVTGLLATALYKLYDSELMRLANTILHTNKALQAKWTGKRKRLDKRFYLICKCYMATVVVQAASNILNILAPIRSSSQNSDSLDLYVEKFVGRRVFAVLLAYLRLKMSFQSMVSVFLLFVSVFMLKTWLSVLKSSPKLRPVEYQSLQVFNIVFRECFTPAILPGVLFCASTAFIIESAMLILFYSQLTTAQISTYAATVLLCSVGLILMFRYMKGVLEESRAVIDILRGPRQPGQWSRAPYYPVTIQFGCFFRADTGTLLTFLFLSLQQVASLVVMFRA